MPSQYIITAHKYPQWGVQRPCIRMVLEWKWQFFSNCCLTDKLKSWKWLIIVCAYNKVGSYWVIEFYNTQCPLFNVVQIILSPRSGSWPMGLALSEGCLCGLKAMEFSGGKVSYWFCWRWLKCLPSGKIVSISCTSFDQLNAQNWMPSQY
jgi:hypothetical protein